MKIYSISMKLVIILFVVLFQSCCLERIILGGIKPYDHHYIGDGNFIDNMEYSPRFQCFLGMISPSSQKTFSFKGLPSCFFHITIVSQKVEWEPSKNNFTLNLKLYKNKEIVFNKVIESKQFIPVHGWNNIKKERLPNKIFWRASQLSFTPTIDDSYTLDVSFAESDYNTGQVQIYLIGNHSTK